MACQLTSLSSALQKILAELDEQQLHIPAIYVARAIEAMNMAAKEREPVGQFPSDASGPEAGVTLN
jgi:hypothetical protein